jgi:seryl-tRNA synthetase
MLLDRPRELCFPVSSILLDRPRELCFPVSSILLDRPRELCFPVSPMLDPRSLAERREEITESCRQRGVTADLDATIAARERVAALQTELQEVNRLRNKHQATGRGNLAPEEREAHVAEGRRIKEEAAALERSLSEAEGRFGALLAELPNLVHPDAPVGGEDEFRELRRVGTPRGFDFEPLDHLQLGERLNLFDFEAGTRVTGQKFYYLKNEAVLLDLALQRLALDAAMEAGFEPYITPDLARQKIVDSMAFSPRGEETQIYSIANTDLDLVGTAEITLGGLYADTILEEATAIAPRRAPMAARARGSTACTSSRRWSSSPSRGPRIRRPCTTSCWPSRSGSSTRWRCPIG